MVLVISSQGTTNLSDTHLEVETRGFYLKRKKYFFFNISKCWRVFFEKIFQLEYRAAADFIFV